MRASPVKEEALALGLEVYEPSNVNSEASIKWCRGREADVFVLFAYGQILKQEILAIPRWAVNVHPSLLPRYRGAAPLERAIMAGESQTGITIIQMSEKVDAGGILLQEPMPIEQDDTLGELAEHVSRAVPFLVGKALEGLKDGSIKPAPQPSEGVTKAPKIKSEERLIDWTRPGWVVHNHVRAFSPEPLTYTYFRGHRLEIVRSRLADREMTGKPGRMDHARGKLLVQCGIGLVELVEVKPEGKKQMSALAFANGYRPRPNELLGDLHP